MPLSKMKSIGNWGLVFLNNLKGQNWKQYWEAASPLSICSTSSIGDPEEAEKKKERSMTGKLIINALYTLASFYSESESLLFDTMKPPLRPQLPTGPFRRPISQQRPVRSTPISPQMTAA